MFEVKVSEEKQNEILEKIQMKDWSWIEEDFGNDDNFQKAIDRLKQEGIVTEELCKITRLDIEIPIGEEQKQDFKRILQTEAYNRFENELMQNGGQLEMHDISRIYKFVNLMYSVPIPLTDGLAEKLELLDSTTYKSSITRDKTIIKNKTIMFSDLEGLLSSHKKGTNEDELISDIIYAYDEGMLSEKEFCDRLGSEELHPSIKNFEKDYESTRYCRVTYGFVTIKDFLLSLESDDARFSEDEIREMEQLREEVVNIDDDVNKREDFIDKWNSFAQDVWKKYLEDENHMLVHVTSGPINGKFNEPYISTSLVIAGKQQATYGDRNGYVIKPKKIVGTMNQDSYTRNSVSNKYYALNSIVVELPQQMEEKQGKGDTEYSEVVIEDFEYESVITFLANKGNYEKLQEMAEAQGNLPIKKISNGKCVPYNQENVYETYQQRPENDTEKNLATRENDSKEEQEKEEKQEKQDSLQPVEDKSQLWENRLKECYERERKAPQGVKSRLVIMKKQIIDAIKNTIRQKSKITKEVERG